ncbi:alpha/beta hydrolase family protein [Flavobacterium phycosphaerae]|uniref:alpha/beta hydrolase family protein n=1 Tax=Flavobacterium phycosphaerae TaxID=2697515 RepID=UPI001389E54D|nr:prolyl oligopeptidase family serine peptidase [Flavobacterium phycosphaerae]
MKKWLFVLLAACPVWSQVAKKQLTEADYGLWSTLEQVQLSEDGRWACYTLTYESGVDTLMVKSTRTDKTYSFAGGTEGRFAANGHFVFRNPDGAVVLVNLKLGTQSQFPNSGQYRLALGGRLLVLLENVGTTAGDLLVVAMDGKVLKRIPKASLFSMNPAGSQLVCDYEGQLLLLDLNRVEQPQLIDVKPQIYQGIVWQANGASLAYLTEGAEAYVGFYQLAEKKHYVFDRNQFKDFPKDGELYHASVTELSVSDDGQRVFFGVKPKQPSQDTGGVQLWNTADKLPYPRKRAINGWNDRVKLAVWQPLTQQLRMVTSVRFPYQELLAGQQLALVYDPMAHEPQFDYDAPVDFYLQDVATGAERLVLEKHSPDRTKMGISVQGNYIAYFKDKDWWVYDIKTAAHHNLTASLGSSFTDPLYDRSGDVQVCGIAGWTPNDDAVLVYDAYDIWSLKTNGSGADRLTKGRETSTVFRVVPPKAYETVGSRSDNGLDLNNGLVLRAVSPSKSGYFNWTPKNGATPIVFESNRISAITKTANGVYAFLREHYHLSPQLVVQHPGGNQMLVYQSNTQQQHYDWGFSKRISYENSKGQLLHGALFYPAGYDADKSYPMVVYIYERLSQYYNEYVNPSLRNQDGFNISNLTSQGYFVLLPDIAYEEGKTGQSAVECVTAAVNEVVAHESVDKKRIGLVGHSFGGYETNFIVTQTNIFAAAVSGSGFADSISCYLSVGDGNLKQETWRYESNQLRMGVPLFDAFDRYLQNSPVTYTPKVKTPLLLWSGTKDNSVNYRQSLEFHLALRRLGKPNILLLYEGGGHSLTKAEHQVDLTRRMSQWWDYYLKGGPKPDWLTPDTF